MLSLFASAAACGNGCCCGGPDVCPPGEGEGEGEGEGVGEGEGESGIVFGPLPSTIACSDDLDDATAGEQVSVTVDTLGDTDCSNVVVTVNGVSVTGVVQSQVARVTVTLTGSDAGTANTITATCVDAGVTHTTTATITDTCATPPISDITCAITSPAPGATLTASPAAVSVSVSANPPLTGAQATFLDTATVHVTVTPDGGGTATGGDVILSGGSGSGFAALPLGPPVPAGANFT
ncbi:MAG TPA: hypothetical protein VGO62_16590, partial [Myxococcota bacterium]